MDLQCDECCNGCAANMAIVDGIHDNDGKNHRCSTGKHNADYCSDRENDGDGNCTHFECDSCGQGFSSVEMNPDPADHRSLIEEHFSCGDSCPECKNGVLVDAPLEAITDIVIECNCCEAELYTGSAVYQCELGVVGNSATEFVETGDMQYLCEDCYSKAAPDAVALTPSQVLAIKCAYADMVGALQSFESGDIYSHDWAAHKETLSEIVDNFEFISEITFDA